MKTLKRISLLVSFLTITGCATVGPTLIIETDEPADDFVVVCSWGSTFSLGHTGGKTIDEDVHVISSGEELSCGINPFGRASLSTSHPVYTGGTVEIIDGVQIIKPITKLQRLDELKAKFEAGEWDKHKKPGAQYASNLVNCGFPLGYFKNISQVEMINVDHFKKFYHEPMLECLKRTFSISKKYDPKIGGQLPEPEEWIRRIWEQLETEYSNEN